MGLFEKKECLICGKKVGVLGSKFLDGSICAGCEYDLAPRFLRERVESSIDGFEYKNITLRIFQECVEYFKNGNMQKKISKELPQYLGAFAFDEEKKEVEIKGKKGVYRFPIECLSRIIYKCVDAQNNNKPRFVFVICSNQYTWLNGYTFEGVFKNDGLFSFTSAKKAGADVERIANDMGIDIISFDDYKKMMKKLQRQEQFEMLKSIFSKI